tara:strand:- start:1024 stop:4188 length:3165 start_codon:yes stop_codon:yes gene_type:complete
MGKVVLNTPQGKVNITIAGDKPTLEESIQINNIIRQSGTGQLMSKEEPNTADKLEQLFDTSTGIKSNALRSALSVAENNEEEDAILRKFDLSDDDFLRDNRGRLALTPTGAAKFGQETDRNILVDEEGFSKYDFSDLAGIVPELVGGIGGAITGQLAIPIPILGAAIGAGIGAGGGQAIEELGEAVTGVQKQDIGEIGKDVAKEATIGFVSDLTFGLAAGAFRAVRRGVTPGKDLTATELETAGLSTSPPIDEAGNVIKPADFAKLSADDKIAAVNRTVTLEDGTVVRGGFGVKPTLSAIRAPSLVARIQAIGEKIFKTSDRLKNNNDVIKQVIDAYKEKFGLEGADAVDVGQILKRGMVDNNEQLIKAEKKAQKQIIAQMKGAVGVFRRAADENSSVDDDLFDIFKNASDEFDSFISGKFRAVDDILRDDAGSGRAGVMFLNNFADHLKRIKSDYAPQIAGTRDPDGAAFRDILNTFESVGGKIDDGLDKAVSFNQLYNLRKTLSDLRMSSNDTVKQELVNVNGTGLLDEIDNMFKQMGDENSQFFRDLSGRLGNIGISANKFKNAGATLRGAQAEFFEGKSILEDLYASQAIKNLSNYRTMPGQLDKAPMNIDIYKNVVKPNNPQFLQRAKDFLREYGGVQGGRTGDEIADEFTARAANQFLENAIETSGIKNFKNVKDFNGTKFQMAIKGLGTTAKELFGDKTDEILKLADEIGGVKISGLQARNVLDQYRDAIGDSESMNGLIDKLTALSETQKILVREQRNRIINKLQDETLDLDPLEAARFLVQKQTKNSEIKPIMNYFAKNQDSAAEQKIRSYYISSMIDDFGESVMTDGKSLNAFADRILAAAEDGKLRTIFPGGVGESMEKFGKILKFNARAAEGGDLVAANIAASPFQNLGKLAKFTILGNRMLSQSYYDDIISQFNGITLKQFKKPADRAKSLGSIIGKALSQSTGQTIDNAVNEAEDQIDAVLESSGVKSQIQNVTQQLGPAINQARTGINQVRNVASAPTINPPAAGTQLAGVNISNPANAFSLGLSPQNIAIAQRTRGTP